MRLTPALLAAILAVPALPGVALAEDIGGLEDAPLIRKELLLRGGRHQINAGIDMSLGDAFVRGWAPTVGYSYYLFNWFGLGVDFGYNLCGALGDLCKTGLTDEIEATSEDVGSGGLEDLSVLTFVVTPNVTLVPLSGKLGILGKEVVHWDTHLSIGAALVGIGNLGDGAGIETGTTIAPMIGIGERFYLDNSMAVTISLRDYIMSRVQNVPLAGEVTGSDEPEKEIENRFMLTVSASFYFPPRVETAR